MNTEPIARDRHQRQSLGGLYDRIKEVRLSSTLSQRVTNLDNVVKGSYGWRWWHRL